MPLPRGQSDRLSSSTYTRDSTGNLISTITGAGTEDYLTDGLGSVVATVNASGAIDQRYSYKPFGLLASTNTGDQNPYRFTGQYQDVTTGTYASLTYIHAGIEALGGAIAFAVGLETSPTLVRFGVFVGGGAALLDADRTLAACPDGVHG